MRGSCTACGFSAGLEAFVADAEWREAVLAAASLPSNIGGLVVRYVGLFRPGKRGLTPARSARLFRELADMVSSEVTFDRRTAHIPSHTWELALQIVLNKPDLQIPLKNHNYLLRVVFAQLDKRTDHQQAEQHQSRRGETRVATDSMKKMGEVIDHQPDIELPKDVGVYRALRMKAEEELKKEGLHSYHLIDPLIEGKMREIILRDTEEKQ